METRVWSVIVAAGRGTRFGAAKQLQAVLDRRMIDWSVDVLSAFGPVIVVGPEARDGAASDVSDPAAYFASGSPLSMSIMSKVERFVTGGATRSASVRAGLSCVAADAKYVLIHDAARPAVKAEIVERVLAALGSGADAVIPVIPVVDTLRTVDGELLDRSKLVAVQTPQGFDHEVLGRAHQKGADASDDSSLVSAIGGHVVHVPGDSENLKVTEPKDLDIIEMLLRRRLQSSE